MFILHTKRPLKIEIGTARLTHSLSVVRQDYIVVSVILLVNLYIRQPWFLMHSVLGKMLAMSSRIVCLLTHTLHIRKINEPVPDIAAKLPH